MLEMILTFLKIGTFIFGGGLVMVAFLEQDAVNTFGWLTHKEFVDAIALGQITPGPFVISSVFIGYKVAGLLGSILAITAISLPSFLMTVVLARQLSRLRKNLKVRAFIKGVSPAVVGMILAAGVTIARASVVDVWTGLLALACLVSLVRFKVDAAPVVVAAGIAGLLMP
jgi:chromate transporter